MNPTAAAIAAIQAEVTNWTPTDAAIALALNAPSIANPAPQARVPKPFGATDLLPVLDQPTIAALVGCPSFPTILTAVQAQNIPQCNGWVQSLAAAGLITEAQASGLTGVVNATEPDPAWPALVSWAQVNLGRPADVSDVDAARPPS